MLQCWVSQCVVRSRAVSGWHTHRPWKGLLWVTVMQRRVLARHDARPSRRALQPAEDVVESCVGELLSSVAFVEQRVRLR